MTISRVSDSSSIRHPRATLLGMITKRNQFMGFLFFPIWVWGFDHIRASMLLEKACALSFLISRGE